MRFVNAVEIECPVGEVFSFLADFENVPRWNYAIVETRKVSPGPVGVGTTYRQIRSLPRRSEESFEVSAFEPDRKLAIRGTLGPFASELEYRLEPLPAGTRVTNEVELRPRGIIGLIGQAGSSKIRDAMARNLRELKRLLESGGLGR